MIKYNTESVSIVFSEIPDEVTLAVEITNCPGTCVGCHSPWLREDIGEELTDEKLDELIEKNYGITCVCFMGEGRDQEALKNLAKHIHAKYPNLKTGLYSGREEVEEELYLYFNYIKVGPYIPERKALNFETTNQRLHEVVAHMDDGSIEKKDITYKFWRKNI